MITSRPDVDFGGRGAQKIGAVREVSLAEKKNRERKQGKAVKTWGGGGGGGRGGGGGGGGVQCGSSDRYPISDPSVVVFSILEFERKERKKLTERNPTTKRRLFSICMRQVCLH